MSPRSTFALFYVAILDEFAWGRGPTALGDSLSWLCFVVFAPVAGWLYDRRGARAVVPMGGLVLGVALALTGQVMSLTQYYLCFGVISAGYRLHCYPVDRDRHALVRAVARYSDGRSKRRHPGQ